MTEAHAPAVPAPRNGASYVKWPGLWTVVAGMFAVMFAMLTFHSMHPHADAVSKDEQVQRDQKHEAQHQSVLRRLDRLETTTQEILRRVK